MKKQKGFIMGLLSPKILGGVGMMVVLIGLFSYHKIAVHNAYNEGYEASSADHVIAAKKAVDEKQTEDKEDAKAIDALTDDALDTEFDKLLIDSTEASCEDYRIVCSPEVIQRCIAPTGGEGQPTEGRESEEGLPEEVTPFIQDEAPLVYPQELLGEPTTPFVQ